MNLVVYIVVAAAYLVSFWKLFELAGRKSWEGVVPVYNLWVWLKVIQKPWWWILLLIFPGVNILMIMVMSVNLAIVFNKREFKDSLMAIFLPFVFFPMLAFNKETKYVGPIDRKIHKKSVAKEWGDAIVFAVIAASIIRTYFLEAFTIPTSSMEKSLLIGDYLFVSKVSYGPKVPNTPLSFPFAHHTLPFTTSMKSYLEWIKLPYQRLPGLSKVERNDIVVFNYPEGDTVTTRWQSERSYNSIVRGFAQQYIQQDEIDNGKKKAYDHYLNLGRKAAKTQYDITIRPVDKRENYIKRCVGIPGDVIEVKEKMLYVNGERAFEPEDVQYNYRMATKDVPQARLLKDKYDINYQDMLANVTPESKRQEMMETGNVRLTNNTNNLPMTDTVAAQLKGHPNTINFEEKLRHKPVQKFYVDWTFRIFPNRPEFNWTEDFFGPITIPRKGVPIQLDARNYYIYERLISVYEGHDIDLRDGKVFIDGEETSEYTPTMDYYWLMGDNRHNSADSRFWGFVPEDHVVGKAVFIWLSLDPEKPLFDGKIRWDRMFSMIHND